MKKISKSEKNEKKPDPEKREKSPIVIEKSRIAGIFLLLIFAVFIFSSVFYLPEFGSFRNKEVAIYYLTNAVMFTGSANVVNAIVWDYRGYDTMGEETVLFAAAMGVYLIIRRKKYERDR